MIIDIDRSIGETQEMARAEVEACAPR